MGRWVGLREALGRRHAVIRAVAFIPSLSLGSAASRVGLSSGQAGPPWEEKGGSRCIPFWPNAGVVALPDNKRNRHLVRGDQPEPSTVARGGLGSMPPKHIPSALGVQAPDAGHIPPVTSPCRYSYDLRRTLHGTAKY